MIVLQILGALALLVIVAFAVLHAQGKASVSIDWTDGGD